MLKLCGEHDLALEPFRVESGGKLGSENLDDDAASKRFIFRHENARHAPARKLAAELVRAAQARLQCFTQLGHSVVIAQPSSPVIVQPVFDNYKRGLVWDL
jgi:hypothetical protein